MTNFKLTIQYDGMRFSGWQKQGNTDNTIQGKIENILSKMTGEEIEIHGSGRTDAGVHAIKQIANFKTNAVLKYRMPNGHREVPLDDVRQGLRILHNYSEEWKITKVGVMGASIGGYIAGHAAIFGVDDARPDFQILLYPVISMLPHLTHLKSRERLLGANPTHEEEEAFSLELHVNSLTPPAFIALASDDEAVSPENSVLYYLALLKNKVSASLHIYPKGGHSFGFRDNFVYKRQWTDELEKWLSTIE